jgi:hypothetical protein
MDASVVRSNIRSVAGLVGVTLALTAVIRLVPDERHTPLTPWQPPAGYTVADTIPVGTDRVLRLWIGPGGWCAQSLERDRHVASVETSAGGDTFTVSEVLGGFVGAVPVAGARAVAVRAPGGVAVHVNVHDQMFVVSSTIAAATVPALLVTPLDAAGRPLTSETSVHIAGRPR